MPHTITYNSEMNFIETRFHGKLTLNEALKVTSEVVQIAKEKNCFLCLSDYREASIGLSTLEIYKLPETVSGVFESQGLQVHLFKRAIVSGADPKDLIFFETVTLNRGQYVRLFSKIEDAKKWLIEK